MFAVFGRVFYVEIESESDSTPSTTFDMVSPAAKTLPQKRNLLMAGGGEKIPEVLLSANEPSYAPLELSVPFRAQTGTVRFGVTGDNWQTVADIKNPVAVEDSGISRVGLGDPRNGDQCTLQLEDSPILWYLDVRMQSHEINLIEGRPPLPPDTARRVLLFDKDGQPIDPGTQHTMPNGYPMYSISAKNFSRIARAVVQTTPYIWAEFRNVPLLPDYERDAALRSAVHDASLESGVQGTATGIAPGYTKKLSDGTTVSITSVTKAIVDNNNWVVTGQPSWRADGEVLALRSDRDWYKIPYSPKYPNPLEQLEVEIKRSYGVDGESHDRESNAVVRFTSKFDPQTHKPIFESDTRIISVAPGDKIGAAQVGVASGPWKTVSSQAIDMPELPAIGERGPGNDPNSGTRTGFEVVVGKDWYVRDLTTNEKIDLASKPLSKYAFRVIAKLKTGEVRELRMGMSAAIGSIYPVPARHGEWTEGYSKLIASEIKSVEIQVRPYEFVEFDGIALQHR